jgi:hypothetical protein
LEITINTVADLDGWNKASMEGFTLLLYPTLQRRRIFVFPNGKSRYMDDKCLKYVEQYYYKIFFFGSM